MSRARFTPPIGGVVKVKLEDGFFTYCRVINSATYAFYDIKTKNEIPDLKQIISFPVKYITSVERTPLEAGRWELIGVLPLEENLKNLPPSAKPDQTLQPDGSYKIIYKIFYGDGTKKITENKEEVIGMEMPIVWSEENIQQILIDMYSGRTSPLKERYTIR